LSLSNEAVSFLNPPRKAVSALCAGIGLNIRFRFDFLRPITYLQGRLLGVDGSMKSIDIACSHAFLRPQTFARRTALRIFSQLPETFASGDWPADSKIASHPHILYGFKPRDTRITNQWMENLNWIKEPT
jgi:hypothetical protein